MRIVTAQQIYNALRADGVPRETVLMFLSWMKRNEEIVKLFERIALQAIAVGVKRWGAKGISEIIRYKARVVNRDKDFKMNNNYSSYLARVFVLKHPEHPKFFEKRKVRGLGVKERLAA